MSLRGTGADRDLALEQDMEQHDAADEIRSRRQAAGARARHVRAETAPKDDVHQRPEGDVEPSMRGAPQDVRLSSHDDANAVPAHARLASSASCRKTPSRSA